MSWPQYPTAAAAPLCLTGQSSPDISALKSSARQQLRKSQSYGEILRPLGSLARMARDPAWLLKSVGDVVWSGSGGDDAPLSGRAPEPALADAQQEARRQALYLYMDNAATYDAWYTAAAELDELEGNNDWKREPASDEYNAALVQSRLRQLDEARASGDPRRMLRLIRTGLTRGLGGMGDRRLYDHAHTGTKALIERYIDAARETIQAFLEVTRRQEGQAGAMDPKVVREELLRARQSFGRSAVLLSGGGTFGINHIGVIKALHERRLLPRIVSGASAGSIVCAVLCTKTDDEIPAVLDAFCDGDLDVFERAGVDDGLYRMAMRFLKRGSLFDVANLVRVMQGLVGHMTFLEAYNRTRRVLNICVSSSGVYETPRLLNYITAPDVMIWSAVAASCSVPLVFSPATLRTKDRRTGEQRDWNPSPQLWIDGSVDNDLPMARLAELFNVNHFVVSQVNPHVVPFLRKEDPSPTPTAPPSFLHRAAAIAKDEALHRMQVVSELGILPSLLTKARSVLGQRYAGDITIFPPVDLAHVPGALRNPSRAFLQQALGAGDRATWPHLARIRNHVAIELALDAAARAVIDRAAFSADEVAHRRRRLAGLTTPATTRHIAARPTSTVMLRPAPGSESALQHHHHASDESASDTDANPSVSRAQDRVRNGGIRQRRRPLSAHGSRGHRPTWLPPNLTLTPSNASTSTAPPALYTALPAMPLHHPRRSADDADEDDDDDDDSSPYSASSTTAMEDDDDDGPLSSPPTHDSGDDAGFGVSTSPPPLSSSTPVTSTTGARSRSRGRWRLFASASSPATPSLERSPPPQRKSKIPRSKRGEQASDGEGGGARASTGAMLRRVGVRGGGVVQGLGLGLTPAGRGKGKRGRRE